MRLESVLLSVDCVLCFLHRGACSTVHLINLNPYRTQHRWVAPAHDKLYKLFCAVELTRCAAQGVAVLHAAGLLHRDVKLNNLLLQSNPCANGQRQPITTAAGVWASIFLEAAIGVWAPRGAVVFLYDKYVRAAVAGELEGAFGVLCEAGGATASP